MIDTTILRDIISTKMPFGKYKEKYIYELPETYLIWFRNKGLPNGRLGILLETMYEIRLNGLEELIYKSIEHIAKEKSICK